MKIAIIVAMQKELNLLLPLIAESRKQEFEAFEATTGKLGKHEVCVLECGIGKVNSAVRTLEVIDSFNPDMVINTGVAGGAGKNVHVLDVLIATGVAYHDVWCGPGTEYGAAAGHEVIMKPSPLFLEASRKLPENPKLKFGLVGSGDIFVSKAEEIAKIRTAFPEAMAVDMESGAIAQVCEIRAVPFGVIRVISDTPGQAENISQYENFWSDAPKETFNTLEMILENL